MILEIHIDIDKSSINKVVPVDYGVVGDCEDILSALVQQVKKLHNQKNIKSNTDWWSQISEWRKKDSLGFKQIVVTKITAVMMTLTLITIVIIIIVKSILIIETEF